VDRTALLAFMRERKQTTARDVMERFAVSKVTPWPPSTHPAPTHSPAAAEL